MKITILMGSPRRNGNTTQLLKPFTDVLETEDVKYDFLRLSEMNIQPCSGCRACQYNWEGFGCPKEDDVHKIFDLIMKTDLILLATPIYSWYCTPQMKALLDRLVYGMNKFYSDMPKVSLWEGKNLAIIATCGYEPKKGADLFEEGMKRYCKHSNLQYIGMLTGRDLGHNEPFMDQAISDAAKSFAEKLIKNL